MFGNTNSHVSIDTGENFYKALTGTVTGGVVDDYTLQIPCPKMPRYITIKRIGNETKTGMQELVLGPIIGGCRALKSSGVGTSGSSSSINDYITMGDGVINLKFSGSDSTYAFYSFEYEYELII